MPLSLAENKTINKMKNFKSTFVLLTLLFQASLSHSQQYHPFSQLPPATGHYARLQALGSEANPVNQWKDQLSFPAELYNDAMLYQLIRPIYLTTAQVDSLKLLPTFPANSSEQTQKELKFLLQLQAERTPEQVEEVLELGKVGYWPEVDLSPLHPQYRNNLQHLFYEVRKVLGEEYTSENSPHTAALLKGIMNDMRLMEFSVKYSSLRARPYQLESSLQPLQQMKSPSFTSGHTLWAYLQAFTLAELIPSKRQAFLDLAYEIGLSREIMGVHFPSDEEEARKLAFAMLQLMWQKEQFKEDFLKAASEWTTLQQ